MEQHVLVTVKDAICFIKIREILALERRGDRDRDRHVA